MYAELKLKKCSRCKEEKETNLFYLVAGGAKPRPECKKCTNTYHKSYRKTDYGAAATKRARDTYHASPCNVLKDKQNKKEWSRFKKYGIDKLQYLKMLEEQNHKCKICPRTHEQEKRGLVVDHCHDSGEVRGLLCHKCNAGIGFFRDNTEFLANAITYLNKFKK